MREVDRFFGASRSFLYCTHVSNEKTVSLKRDTPVWRDNFKLW